MHRIFTCLFGAVLFCLIFTALAFSQVGQYGTIRGHVTDPHDAAVVGANVTATSTATGAPHRATTGGSGDYVIPNLDPGVYDVKVEAASFGMQQAKGVKLILGAQQDLNFKLAPAGASTNIEVTAQAPLLETANTQVSTAITDLDMQRLPTFAAAGGGANDYAQLALSAPGVKLDTSTLTTDLIAPGSINNRGNVYNVDGANITDQVTSGRDTLGASVDEVQEMQVLTNNYNAEYGEASGLILNVKTKSGTNGVHGEGHMYFRGRNLTASTPFYNLGFIDPSTGLVADPRCPHNGTADIAGCPRAPFHRKEGGFTLGGPFIKNRLFWFGSYELSRQGAPLTLTPKGRPSITLQQPVNDLLYTGKVDWIATTNNVFSFRYNVERFIIDNQIVQTSTNITPDDLTSSINHNNLLTASWVSTITPNLVNEARGVYFRFLTSTPDKTTAPGVLNTTTGTISGADFCCPQGGLQERYQYSDNLTWTHGSHTFKMGGVFSYYPWTSLFPQFHFGQYRTPDGITATQFTFAIGPGQVTSKDNVYGAYFQDTWKITPKLTLNAGIRYDLEAGAFKGGKIHGPNGTCFQGNGIIPACSSDHNNWQPRLGLAWQIFPNTLLRASGAVITQLAFNNVVLDSLNFDGTTLNTVTTTNPAILAFFPNAPPAALLNGAASCLAVVQRCGRVRPIATNLHNPNFYDYNLSLQHQWSPTLMTEVQYIGQFGFGLFGERDRNAAPIIADPAHPGFFYFGNRPDPRFTAIRTNENSRTSHYNGLLVSATKRFSNHVQFVASYTWSHALTSGEDFFGLSEPGDSVHIRPELGPAFNDIRHAANFGVVLDSGTVTQTQILRVLTNNLGLSILGQLQSGRPYPFSTGTAGFANGIFFATGSETQQRPNVLANGVLSTSGVASAEGTNALFGPGAVAACTTAGFSAAQCSTIQNTFLAPGTASALGAVDSITGDIVDFSLVNGNLGRDAGRGAPFTRLDASLKKTIKVTEHVGVELRVDAFNFLNHANYQGFNAFNITSLLGFGALNPAAPAGTGFFNCVSCMRPNGTLVGSNNQVLTVQNIQHGIFDTNLVKPIFGGIGDPSTTDIARTFQLSFHVRF